MKSTPIPMTSRGSTSACRRDVRHGRPEGRQVVVGVLESTLGWELDRCAVDGQPLVDYAVRVWMDGPGQLPPVADVYEDGANRNQRRWRSRSHHLPPRRLTPLDTALAFPLDAPPRRSIGVRWRRCALAYDELRCKLDPAVENRFAVVELHGQPRSRCPHLREGLADGGQRRTNPLRDWKVVEAHDV